MCAVFNVQKLYIVISIKVCIMVTVVDGTRCILVQTMAGGSGATNRIG